MSLGRAKVTCLACDHGLKPITAADPKPVIRECSWCGARIQVCWSGNVRPRIRARFRLDLPAECTPRDCSLPDWATADYEI